MFEQKKELRTQEIKIRVFPSLKESIKLMSNGNMSKFIIDCIKKADTKDYCIKGLYEIMVNNMKPVKKLTEKEIDIIKEIEEMLNV